MAVVREGRAAGHRRPDFAKSTDFVKNFTFHLHSFVVDVAVGEDFDLFRDLGVVPPDDLLSDWAFPDPIPLYIDVQCQIVDGRRPLTCPLLLKSGACQVHTQSLPLVTASHNIARLHHVCTWDREVEMAIRWCELPVEATLMLKFWACGFLCKPVEVGCVELRLFTQKRQRLRVGPYFLGLQRSSQSTLQRHVRRVAIGRESGYDFVDDQFRTVMGLLGPGNAELFFGGVANSGVPPRLNSVSRFAELALRWPSDDQTRQVRWADLAITPIESLCAINPCQRLYQELARAQGLGRAAARDSLAVETLNSVKQLGFFAKVSLQQRNVLLQCGVTVEDALLPALFRSMEWGSDEEIGPIVSKLVTREPCAIEYALEFFGGRYPAQPVREFAVRSIEAAGVKSPDELLLYVPQLLQAIKGEHAEGLQDVLLQHACNNEVFASSLLWAAYTEIDVERIGGLVQLMLQRVSPEARQELERQRYLMDRVRRLLEVASAGAPSCAVIRGRIIDGLKGEEFMDLRKFPATRLPVAPDVIVCGMDPSDVRVFASKLRPAALCFERADGGKFMVMFKLGDDMRQDVLILQLFRVMDAIFRNAGLHLGITAYRAIAMAKDYGACELVPEARAISDIIDDKNVGTIRRFLGIEGQPASGDPKIELFTSSLAAYSVMTYVLKIGDRHDNNILVCRDGRLLHIDFGYILGDVTKPFTPPLKLSQVMMDTIGQDGMGAICGLAGSAFNALRKRARLIFVLIELMFTAPLTCFQQNPERRLLQVENTLLLNVTEIEAVNSLQSAFSESLNSRMQVIWDHVHSAALAVSSPSAEGDTVQVKKK